MREIDETITDDEEESNDSKRLSANILWPCCSIGASDGKHQQGVLDAKVF